MLAYNFFGWEVPHAEVVVPALVGVVVAALALISARLFSRGTPGVQEQPPEAKPEHDPFVQGSLSENRRAYRRGGNPVEVFISRPSARDHNLRGRVSDRSVGGLGLEVPLEFAPGTVLKVLPVNAPNITPWVDVEVRSCRPVKEGWEIGCQFVKTPSWEVLLLFG